VFRDPPIKVDSGSMANQACMEITARILKLIAYIITFVLVLFGGVIAKGL
jgi:chitin synthase